MRISRIFLITVFSILTYISFGQYKIETVPDPKRNGQDQFVSNPDGILTSDEVSNINAIAQKIESSSKAEIAIVAIDNYDGEEDDFQFAYNLFQHWGIGKKETNNGLLLLVVKDRRKYRFITGYGLEGLLPDVTLKQIGEMDLVPDFKKGNYGLGIENAMADIEKILLSPNGKSELQSFYFRKNSICYKIISNGAIALGILIIYYFFDKSLQLYEIRIGKKKKTRQKYRTGNLWIGFWVLCFLFFIGIFLLGFFHINIYSWDYLWIYALIIGTIGIALQNASIFRTIKSKNLDISDINDYLSEFKKKHWLALLLSPFSWITFRKINNVIRKNRNRILSGPEGQNWERLHKFADARQFKYLLTDEKKKEIQLGIIEPEFWINKETKMVKSMDWQGPNYDKYETCPKCQARTYEIKKMLKTIKKATYSKKGEGEYYRVCSNCQYRLSLGLVILPMLVESSSSSSSSSSGSSSSSSSGSWGGGSSGGGGAGGSW